MIEGLLMNTEEINQLWAEVCSRVKSYEGIIGPQVDALFSQLFPPGRKRRVHDADR